MLSSATTAPHQVRRAGAEPLLQGQLREARSPPSPRSFTRRSSRSTQLEDLKAGDAGRHRRASPAATRPTKRWRWLDGSATASSPTTHYSRAGYGKLGFRCRLRPRSVHRSAPGDRLLHGPRQAFAKDVHRRLWRRCGRPRTTPAAGCTRPLSGSGHPILNAYATSVDSAIEAAGAEGGWVYDAEGNDYVEGVRYKKIPGDIRYRGSRHQLQVQGRRLCDHQGRRRLLYAAGPELVRHLRTTPSPIS